MTLSIANRLDEACQKTSHNTQTITQSQLRSYGFENIQLRDYQLSGVTWFDECASQRRGGILADEMGLGKTCQTVAFFACWLKRKPKSAILLVSPLSVMDTWTAELRKCLPSVNFTVYYGNPTEREKHREHYNPDTHPIMLTSYEICRKLRFILTGTPVQNNLSELYNLLCFVAPRYFPVKAHQEFVAFFSQNTELDETAKASRDEKLRQWTRPFMLRRTKAQVHLDLPPRLDVLIYHSLSALQVKIYRALLTRSADVLSYVVSDHLDTVAAKKPVPEYRLNNLLMELRKCVSHPYLFDGVEPEPFELGQHLIENSAKLVLLDQLISHLYNPFNHGHCGVTVAAAPVHKVLIFSQMTRMLDIIQDYLTIKNYAYERLDGSVRGEDRFTAIRDFSHMSDSFIFLLSTRAGGQGLNLIAADTVILIDSDFNPQNDIQASARAHRIGQTKPVRIIRLVGRDTVEEAILARSVEKLQLTNRVLQPSEDTTSMTDDAPKKDELSAALKFGLARLMDTMLKLEDPDLDDAAPTAEPTVVVVQKPDFARILGDTDPATGHWLPPLEAESGDSHQNWVVLTDREFQCNVTDADREAVSRLKEEHDLAAVRALDRAYIKSEPTVPRTRAHGPVSLSPANQITGVNRIRVPLSAEEAEARRLQNREAAEAREQRYAEAAAKRAAVKLEKKKSNWLSIGYTSTAVFRTEDVPVNPSAIETDVLAQIGVAVAEPLPRDEAWGVPGIYYLLGDASEPLTSLVTSGSAYPQPAFVCLSVDESGSWPDGGFFGALSKRTKEPAEAYELAGDLEDLTLGDCHIIPILTGEGVTQQCKTFDDYLSKRGSWSESVSSAVRFCGILVSQLHTKQSQSNSEPPPLNLPALEKSLCSLGKACQCLKQCSVHIPRIGYGTRAFQWYSVERLLRKYLVEQCQLPVYVYYYRRSHGQHASSSTVQSPCHSSQQTVSKQPDFKTEEPPIKRAKNLSPGLSHLRNLFSGHTFYLWLGSTQTSDPTPSDSVLSQAKRLKRLIAAYDGDMLTELNPKVTHVIALCGVGDDSAELEAAQPYHLVLPSWLEDSVRSMRCLPEDDYIAS